MAEPRYTASVTIEMTVEVPAPVSYGNDWNIKTMHEQAIRETVGAMQEKFRGAKIIGTPKIKFCTFKQAD